MGIFFSGLETRGSRSESIRFPGLELIALTFFNGLYTALLCIGS